jgi:hypothetical protein
MGPLVGVSFIDAVRIYGEASGVNGTSAGVGEAFSPLVGIWAPTFSACELAAAFLLPFVAIRLVAGDRQSGALKLELQHPMPAFVRIGFKALVLLAGWFFAMLPAALAVVLWKCYGGSVYPPELATIALGHTLNAGLTIAVADAQLTSWLDGQPALEYTLGADPVSTRGTPNPDLFPANNPVLRPPVSGRVGLWSKTDSTSYFKDYVVNRAK